MSIDVWLAYLFAYTAVSLIPGPSVFMVLGQTLSRGLHAAVYCIFGDALGGIVMMAVALVGIGTVLLASAEIFTFVKWAGVAYMAWLGVSQIVTSRQLTEDDLRVCVSMDHRHSSFRAGFLTGVLNPKAVLFYTAFLPQFVDPQLHMAPQFVILMATSTIIVFVVLGIYALLALQIRRSLQSLRAQKSMGYAGGSIILGGSVLLATN